MRCWQSSAAFPLISCRKRIRTRNSGLSLGESLLWAIWGTASENGGSKVIKTAPKELKEKYQQVFA